MDDKTELSSGFVGEDFPDEDENGQLKEFYSSSSGYSRLFICRRHGRLHVLKCLLPLYAGQDFYVRLLRKEFDIGYRLEHPHICRTIGWEKHEELGYCILLEYVDGISLKAFMEKGMLTRALAYKFAKDICEALQYVHSKQIVHRDLKPENIMITHNGNNVKLIDFGLSDCDDYDILKIPAGTRKYIAPELLSDNATWDYRVDIFSLGVVLLDMSVLLEDEYLNRIALSCAQVEPDKRCDSAQEVSDILHKRKKRITYKTISAVAVLLLLLLWGGWHYLLQATEKNVQLSVQVYTNSSTTPEEQEELLSLYSRSIASKKKGISHAQDSIEWWRSMKKRLDVEFPTPRVRKSIGYKKRVENLQKEISGLPL